MSFLQQHEGDNIGSIAKLEGAYHTLFASFNPAVFSGGSNWQGIPFHEESGNIRLGVSKTDQGMLYKYSGSVRITNIRTAADQALFPLMGKVLVLKVTDMNGKVYIIGAPNNPVNMEMEADSGSSFPDTNGYMIAYVIEQTYPAFTE